MSTTSAQGGYLMSEEWATDIANMINNLALAPSMMKKVEMTGSKLHVNEFLTDLSVAWATEATDKSVTKPTFSQDDLTLKFLYAVITATKEVNEDSIVDLESMLMELVAQNMALEIEQEAFEGTTFTGIADAGANAVAQSGANISYPDLTAVINNASQLTQYKKNAGFWMTYGALNMIMNLVDGNNRPLYNMNNPLAGTPSTLLGKPVYISDQIADTTGTGGTTSIYFGDMSTVWLGKKRGAPDMNTLFTETAIISSSTSVTENLFLANKVGWRIEKRCGILVAVPSAWVKLTGVKFGA